VGAEEYEARLRAFHSSLAGVESASFRVDALPFGDCLAGYEDWYLVEDWAALGELNAIAVDSTHRAPHDAAAAEAGQGWGGVYALVHGEPEPPAAARWSDQQPGAVGAMWQRQMVLGPAPEYCAVEGSAEGRNRVV
jgi:hypothetical protein